MLPSLLTFNIKRLNAITLSLGLLLLSALSIPVYANQESAEIHDFLSLHFTKPPKKQFLWLTKDLKPVVKQVLGHNYPKIRLAYWCNQTNKCAWVLDEIGKEKPITVGIVTENAKIQSLRILTFRESRGWEVKLPSFTRQYHGATLNSTHPSANQSPQLSNQIDGISGATLSVRAVNKLAKLALIFDQKRHKQTGK